MLTIFSCPKPFRGHINIIQRNAIRSWTLLQPRPEIILIGNEQGIAELCREFSLRHIAEVERNEYGTPLVSSLFNVAQDNATYPFMCYANADIILMSDFMEGVQKVVEHMNGQQFLLVGQRWNVELTTLLNFEPDWESRLREYVKIHAPRRLYSPRAIDYFFFPKGLWENIPEFAIGRSRWDNWFIHKACEMKIPVIDASSTITTAVHQHHDYPHIYGGLKGVEFKYNAKLLSHMSTIWDATYVLSSGELKKAPVTHRIGGYMMKIIFSRTVYPFLYPLILLAKGLRGCKKMATFVIQLIRSRLKP